jgi:hypothetical protein
MAVRAMDRWEIREACEILHYHPHTNVSGLCNGTARILYDSWTNNDKNRPGGMVYVHSLIPEPRFLTKGFLREMFKYAFETVDWVVGVTPGCNNRALLFNARLGFEPCMILPSGYAKGIDLCFQRMHYQSCRYYQRPKGDLT